MTDNTQGLGEILDEFLTDIYMNNEHFAANQEALDKTKKEPMQALLDWHNKQIEEVLDRLEKCLVHVDEHICRFNDGEQVCDCYLEADKITRGAIVAERNKLKED